MALNSFLCWCAVKKLHTHCSINLPKIGMLGPDDAKNKSNTAEASISSMWCRHAKSSNCLSNAFCMTVISPVWTPVLALVMSKQSPAKYSGTPVHWRSASTTAFPVRRPVPDPGNFGIANNVSTFSPETTYIESVVWSESLLHRRCSVIKSCSQLLLSEFYWDLKQLAVAELHIDIVL